MALSASLAAVGCVGLWTYFSGGFPERVPANIAVNNVQIKWTNEQDRNKNCLDFFPAFSGASYCQMEKASHPTVMLVGDSHSNHLYPGLSAAIVHAQDNLLNLGQGGCPFLLGVEVTQKGVPYNCIETVKRIGDVAMQTTTVHTIVLSFRGPSYITGKGFGDAASESVIDQALQLPGSPEIKDYSDIFKTSLRSTVRQLLTAKKEVVFVLDVPELGFDPRACIETHRFQTYLVPGLRKNCGVARSTFAERNAQYREAVITVLRDFPSVKIFDAAEIICDAGWCSALKDGMLLYRDDDHLSVLGSKIIAGELVKLIDPSDQ